MKHFYLTLFCHLFYWSISQAINLDSNLKAIAKLKPQNESIFQLIRFSYSLKLEHNNISLHLLDSAIELSTKLKQDRNIAASKICLGDLLRIKGDLNRALKTSLDGLRIAEKIKDTLSISFALNNLGTIYVAQKKYDLAISYFKKSLVEKLKLPNKNKIYTTYTNIGLTYVHMRKLDSAEKYLMKAILLSKSDLFAHSATLINYSTLLMEKNKYNQSLSLINNSIDIKRKIEDMEGLIIALQLKGEIYNKLNNHKKSLLTNMEALILSKKSNLKSLELMLCYNVSNNYNMLNKHQEAYNYLLKYTKLNDSLNSIENQKELEKLSKIYQTEKKDLQIQKASTELTLNKVKDKQKTIIILLVCMALIISIFLIIIAYINYKKSKQSAKIVFDQKQKLEEKQKEIIDSIKYAKRIQSAHLPNAQQIKKMMNIKN